MSKEETPQERLERLELVLQASSEGVWDIQGLQGDCKCYISRTAKEIFGSVKSAEFFEDLTPHLHEEDRKDVSEAWQQFLATGGQEFLNVEFRLLQNGDDYVWVRLRGIASRDDQGLCLLYTSDAADD